MTDLETVAGLPGVSAAVLGDLEGTFLGALRTGDGETIAAEMGFVGSALLEDRASCSGSAPSPPSRSPAGPAPACWWCGHGPLITALVSPPQSLGPVERAVDTAFQEWT